MTKIDKKKEPGIAALKTKQRQVVAKIGYMKKGGKVKKKKRK